MSFETLELIVNVIIGLVCFGAVPFAMRVVSELASINTEIKNLQWQSKAISVLQERVHEMELKLAQHCSKT